MNTRLASAISTGRCAIGLLERWFAPVAALAARLYVAQVFFRSGLTKIDDWDTTVALFTDEYHVPVLPPNVAALMGAGGELFFPALLTLGLAGRLGALGLSAVNVMAVVSYWHVLSQQDALLTAHLNWGLLLALLLAYGPGTLSVDGWLKRRWLAS